MSRFSKVISEFLSILMILAFLLRGELRSQEIIKDDLIQLPNAGALADELANSLQQIKTYEYGQSRAALGRIQEVLRKIDDSAEKQHIAEAMLLDFLQSEATLPSKQFICETMSTFAGDASVPVLDQMLYQSETVEMALYALERIPGKKASLALQKALSKTKGNTRIGIVNALGNRRDIESVELLVPLLQIHEDLALFAIKALGKIGGEQAAQALEIRLSITESAWRSELVTAYLQCAHAFSESGEPKRALKIYQSLFKPEFESQVRYAALRGIIHNSDQKASEIVTENLRSTDPITRKVAIQLITEIPATKEVNEIANALSNLLEEEKVQILTALSGRNDDATFQAFSRALKDTSAEVRVAALNALSLTARAEAVPILAYAAAQSDALDKKAAREGLYRLQGPATDEKIIQLIPEAEEGVKAELIRSLAERHSSSANALLIDLTNSQSPLLRLEAIKALSVVGNPPYLQNLIDLLIRSIDKPEAAELEKCIIAIALRIPENESRAALIIEKAKSLKDNRHLAVLYGLMGKIGDAQSLPILRSALQEKDYLLKTTAIRALSDWPDSQPIDDLFEMAKTAKDENQRILAWRGYLQLIAIDHEQSGPDKTRKYEQALKISRNADEKRMALAGLALITDIEALKLIVPFLKQTELNEEAESAALKIAENLDPKLSTDVLPILRQINQQTQNQTRREKSAELIKKFE